MRRVGFTAFIVFATLLALAVGWALRGVVGLFVLSLVVAAAAQPLVDRLHAAGWPPRLALAAVYLAGFGAAGALAYVLGGELLLELTRGAEALGAAYEKATSRWTDHGAFGRLLVANLPPPEAIYASIGALEPAVIAERAIGTTLGLLELLGSALVVIALSLYWSIDRDAFERLWLSLLPVEGRVRARAAFAEVRSRVGAEFGAELGQSFIAAAVLALVFRALGFGYWAVPATAIAMFRMVPLVGVVAALATACLAGLGDGPAMAGAAAAATAIVLVGLRRVIGPRAFRAPSIDPILLILVVLGLTHDFGFLGLVAAPMVAAAIEVLFGELVRSRPEPAPVLARLAAIDELRARAARLDRGSAGDAARSPELISMIDRLDGLILRADQTSPT